MEDNARQEVVYYFALAGITVTSDQANALLELNSQFEQQGIQGFIRHVRNLIGQVQTENIIPNLTDLG